MLQPHLSFKHSGSAQMTCWIAGRSLLIEEYEGMIRTHLRLGVKAPFVAVPGLGTIMNQRRDDGPDVRVGGLQWGRYEAVVVVELEHRH